jgi:hypothetical protein
VTTPVIPAAIPQGASDNLPAPRETSNRVQPAPVVEAPPGVPNGPGPAQGTAPTPGGPDTLLPAPGALLDDSLRAVEPAATAVLDAAGALPEGSLPADPVPSPPDVIDTVTEHAAALPAPVEAAQAEPPATAPAPVDAGGLGAPSLP